MSSHNKFPTPVVRGYDVVAYFDGEAKPGDAALNVAYDDDIYFFSSEDNQRRFQMSPQTYIPAYGGWCATAMSEGKLFAADPTNFKVSNGRLFLFYRGIGGDTRPDWEADETNREQQANQHWTNGVAATSSSS